MAFHALHGQAGPRAVEEVVPEVLRRLDDDTDDRGATRARSALREICRRRARELLTGVIPQLLKRPMSERRADAYASSESSDTTRRVATEKVPARFVTRSVRSGSGVAPTETLEAPRAGDVGDAGKDPAASWNASSSSESSESGSKSRKETVSSVSVSPKRRCPPSDGSRDVVHVSSVTSSPASL